MNKFTQSAKKQTTLSPVMTGREKVSTDYIVGFESGVTVTEFDLISMQNAAGETNVFPVLAFAEKPECYFFGGTVVTKIVSEWVSMYGGDIEAASAELKASGGVKMKFRKTRTKNGNNVTSVEIID